MKSRWYTATLLTLMAGLLLRSQQAADGVRQGLQLCAVSVIPSLFPFFVLSSLYMDTLTEGDTFFFRLIGHLFRCGNVGARTFFLSLLGGYPVGPRLIGGLCREGRLSKEEGTQLLTFCNNAGPAFILGFVGLGHFNSLRTGVLLYFIHGIAAVLTALLLRPQKSFPARTLPALPKKSFPEALVHSIADAGTAMLQICSFVTFFCAILSLPPSRTLLPHPLLLGIVELTQGILQLPDTFAGFVMAAALLAWGGLSVHCQTAAVLAGTDLSMRPYCKGKLCQTFFSILLAILLRPLLQ